jgi:hypothetical protein
MKPEEFLTQHGVIIAKTFAAYCKWHEIRDDEVEYLHGSMVAELYFAAPSFDPYPYHSPSYVQRLAWNILIDIWREGHAVKFGKGKEQPISSISELSEELLANKLQFGEYRDRGGCSHFAEDNSHSPFPGYEDLDSNDQSTIDEFCNSSAEDTSRRATLRPLVDSILETQGITSGIIHDYSTRRNRKPS